MTDNEYQNTFYELNTSNYNNTNDNLTKEQLNEEKQLEFNGGIIKIRQSRVKAPMVKKAIALILSSKEVYYF